MSEKKLYCSRIIENFNPPDFTEKRVHKVCESAADAFLGQIEYGRDYIVSTDLVKEDWADGFGTKYTYNLKFDELVRCRDCKHYEKHGSFAMCMLPDGDGDYACWIVEPDGFCAWGEKVVSE